jgi:hypothetical protein
MKAILLFLGIAMTTAWALGARGVYHLESRTQGLDLAVEAATR